MPGIGIDFGTTNSSIVCYDEKKKKIDYLMDKTFEGKPLPYPSFVWYNDNHVIVGKEAKNNFNTYSGRPGHCLVKSIKSLLGSNEKITVFGDSREPFQITSDILKYLKHMALNNYRSSLVGSNFEQAVFTVPVNFSGRQRAELRKAAELAGINVQTFIHEPFAAVIGYLFGNSNNELIHKYKGKYILVFDWGGGTLDITVVKVDNNGDKLFEVGTSQLTGIAGDKFDEELMNICINRFKDKYIERFRSEYLDEKLRGKVDRILYYVERCKINLSSYERAHIESQIFAETDGSNTIFYDINEEIERKDFEKSILIHVNKAVNKIYEALKAAQINSEQIALVLMTGGSSKIPLVIDEVRKIFGYRAISVDNCDTIIAEGAAIVAANNWIPFLSKNIMIELSDGSFWTVFEKGTPLKPRTTVKEADFICVDNRNSEARIIVSEGYEYNTRDKNLGILNVPLPEELPYPHFFDEIKTTYEIDNNFVLKVGGYSEFARLRKKLKIYDLCFGLKIV